MSTLETIDQATRLARPAYTDVIAEIGRLAWADLTEDQATDVAWAYYFFSVQFRENLRIACRLHPEDAKLRDLDREECNTDNLSPWPGVADAGEKMNHDEFMRRLLALSPIPDARRALFEDLGERYLADTRRQDDLARAQSIASYEDGGLELVFRAMLTTPQAQTPLLRAFRHFLSEHIRFDSDPDQGHGALARHLRPDDRILPLWAGFRDLLLGCVPALAPVAVATAGEAG
ncbi:MAG: hypothetical protein P4M07_00130 [Xanthobacteraceae bacterium]|nr:hypothetical protein [Xanthobacteraceae bacterium]